MQCEERKGGRPTRFVVVVGIDTGNGNVAVQKV